MAVPNGMTHKERVYAALRHETPDRIPRFIWLGRGIVQRLTEKLHIPASSLDFWLDNDILQCWLSINREMERPVAEGSEFTDEWGINWRREGYYNTAVFHPLKGRDSAFIKSYPLPDPKSPERFVPLDKLLAEYGNEYFIGADVSGTLFEPACHLRDMSEFLVDLAEKSQEASIILDRLEAFSCSVALESLSRGADWIWLGDDLGSQSNMLLSPDLWRFHFKPRMKRIIQTIRREKPEVFIAYHSCGTMAPVIPDLAEIGIDVLNPLQESAAGMDQKSIKKQFGDRITLMCGPDTQNFTPKAKPREVAAKVRELTAALGAGGGYIFAVSHHIQHDTPDENLEALLDALKEVAL